MFRSVGAADEPARSRVGQEASPPRSMLGVEREGAGVATIRTFYINRASDEARRASIERGLSQESLAAERIVGIEGLAVPQHLRKYFFDGDKALLAAEAGRGWVLCQPPRGPEDCR